MLRSGYARALGRPVSIWETIRLTLEFFSIFSIGRTCVFLFGTAVLAMAQDCRLPINFSVASGTITPSNGVGTPFNNKGIACVNWQVNIFASGVSALSIQFESATDLGGNTPGAFSIFGGTPLSGTNPITVTTQTSTFTGMFPWLRMNFTSASGSGNVVGVVYGFKATSSSINNIFGGPLPLHGIALASLNSPNGFTFTQLNFAGTTTLSNLGNCNQLVKNRDGALQWSGYHTSLSGAGGSAGSYTFTVGMKAWLPFVTSIEPGIYIFNSGTGKLQSFKLREDGATVNNSAWTNATTFSADTQSQGFAARNDAVTGWNFFRIVESGGVRSFFLGGDGVNFTQMMHENIAGSFVPIPDNIGVGVLNQTPASGADGNTNANIIVCHMTVTNP